MLIQSGPVLLLPPKKKDTRAQARKEYSLLLSCRNTRRGLLLLTLYTVPYIIVQIVYDILYSTGIPVLQFTICTLSIEQNQQVNFQIQNNYHEHKI